MNPHPGKMVHLTRASLPMMYAELDMHVPLRKKIQVRVTHNACQLFHIFVHIVDNLLTFTVLPSQC
jgi:hypothetical protein